jgi:hypothetical protein
MEMKTIFALSALLLAPLALGAAVQVEWVNPGSYKDAWDSNVKSDKNRQIVLDQLGDFIVKEASPMLKDGWNLKISVTQLDMSGEYEPWTDHPDVRIIKGAYFGKIDFSYVLTDDKGAVVKKGSEDLVNKLLTPPAFQDKDEIEPYLRTSLRDWITRTIK